MILKLPQSRSNISYWITPFVPRVAVIMRSSPVSSTTDHDSVIIISHHAALPSEDLWQTNYQLWWWKHDDDHSPRGKSGRVRVLFGALGHPTSSELLMMGLISLPTLSSLSTDILDSPPTITSVRQVQQFSHKSNRVMKLQTKHRLRF